MAGSRIIAVVGATGAQGGSLCDAILSDPAGGFACRAITRNPGSNGAKALMAKGVEVIAADLDDEASLTESFAGAHGVFGVTNYPEILSVEPVTLDDTTQGLAVSDSRMPTLLGKYKCPHSDSKGQIDHVYSDLDLPVTFLLT